MKNFKRLLVLFVCLFVTAISLAILSSCGDCLHPIRSSWTTVKEASCTEEGRREAKCSDCGEIISETIKKKAHDYDEYYSDNNASCTFIGTLSAQCKNCDAKKTKLDDGNPYGHTYFDGVCSECDDTMTLVESYNVSKNDTDSVFAKLYLAKDGHYELDIVGTGKMRDFTASEGAPYNSFSTSINTLHIYEGVSRIGAYAFAELTLIDNIYMEAGHKSFGINAFYEKLTPSVTHAFDLTSWASYDFEGEGIPPLYMTNLIYTGKIVRDNGTVKVEDKSTRIGNLTLREGITKINPYAFYNEAHILTVTIPLGLSEIGEYAFYGCAGIEEVYAPTLETWCNINFAEKYANPLIYGRNLFINDTLVRELVIPAGISEIKRGSFEGCESITSLKIEADISLIPSFAFAGCSNLASIELSPAVASIDPWAFYACTSLRSLTLPSTLTELKADSFRECRALNYLDTGDGISNIPSSAFAGCTQLVRVRLGTAISNIDADAFLGCGKIYEIANASALDISNMNIAKNALFIHDGTEASRISEITADTPSRGLIFYIDEDNGKKLIIAYAGTATVLTLDATIMGGGYSVYKNAFSAKTLKALTISDGVKELYPDAFSGATIKNLIISDIATWCRIDFLDKSANPAYLASVINIGKEGDSTVTTIEIPDGVTEIKSYAFAGFGSVKTFTIPKSVSKIGKDAFIDCISAIKTTSGASYVGKWLVGFESGKTSVTINQDTVGIADGVFDNIEVTAFTVSANQLSMLPAEKVLSLTIRDGELASSAFAPFTALKSITINSAAKGVNESTFLGASATEYSISSAYLPYIEPSLIKSLTLTSGSIKRADAEPLTSLTTLVISSGVTSIEQGCFKDMTSLLSLSIRGGVTVIPKDAFSGCTSLNSIALYNGINSIREGAFEDCTEITTTKGGVLYVGGWVVGIDKSLEGVVIEKDIIGIADGVLGNGSNVKSIYFMGLLAEWNKVKQNANSNTQIARATVYHYRELSPYTAGNFWHYVDGVPTPWPPYTKA